MKLAEALSIRADLQKKVEQLKERINDSSKVQEGDTPTENVDELFGELQETLSALEDIIFRINATNMQVVHDGESITKLIARRDVLSMRVSIMKGVLGHVTDNGDRFSRNEIKYVRTVDVKELRKKADSYAKQLRELDLKIQQLNWMFDLV